MYEPLISIITPIYNAESFIVQCATSLFSQNYQNLEFIFWDDGSTDNSIRLLKEVLAQFPKREKQTIIEYNKANLGVTATRQRAFSRASGDYFWAVDSDDWIESDSCTTLVNCLTERPVDIVFFDFRYEENGMSSQVTMSGPEDAKTFLLKMLKTTSNGNLANKLIRRVFWLKHVQPVPENVTVGEDFSCTMQLLRADARLRYLPEALYHYRMHSGSATHKISAKYYEKVILFHNHVEHSLQNEEERKAFAEFQARLKLNIVASRTLPLSRTSKLFPSLLNYLSFLPLPCCYKLALRWLDSSFPWIGLIFIKVNFLQKRIIKFGSQA